MKRATTGADRLDHIVVKDASLCGKSAWPDDWTEVDTGTSSKQMCMGCLGRLNSPPRRK